MFPPTCTFNFTFTFICIVNSNGLVSLFVFHCRTRSIDVSQYSETGSARLLAKSETGNPKQETQNPKRETRNAKRAVLISIFFFLFYFILFYFILFFLFYFVFFCFIFVLFFFVAPLVFRETAAVQEKGERISKCRHC